MPRETAMKPADEDVEPIEFADEDDDEESGPDDIPKEQRTLRTQAYDKSVSDVVKMMEEEDIIFDPEYQRNYVWENKRAALLIESILLNVPIPVIYVAEDEDSCWSVVDGLQRLNSIKRFFANEFKLQRLEVLKELNGLKYADLNAKAQRILRNGILRFILIFKESHPEIKYDIFMRLNRGAIKLTEQELRNCLYRGTMNKLIMELRKNKHLLAMLGLSKPHKRMNDAELILRYFTISASYDATTGQVRNYSGKMKSALNRYINDNRNPDSDTIQALLEKFESTIGKVYDVFGAKAFQRIYPDGKFEGRPNRAIVDFIMTSFERFPADLLRSRAAAITELLRVLPETDPKFKEAISIGTSDKKRLEYRLQAWNSRLADVLRSPTAS